MQIAQQIGSYQIVEEIARGGMAVVFRATRLDATANQLGPVTRLMGLRTNQTSPPDG